MILSENEKAEFVKWFKGFFEGKVESVKATNRLSSSPAMITNHESGAMRRMMKMVDAQDVNYQAEPLPQLEVEFNPEHEIIVRMFRMRETDPVLAKVCAEQVYDNCLVAAGLMDDSRTMLGRLNDLLLVAIKSADIESAPNNTNIKKEVNVEDDHKVLEAEIVEPDDDKKYNTTINDTTEIDFDGKIDKELKKESSEEQVREGTIVESGDDEKDDTKFNDSTEIDFDGDKESKEDEEQDRFIEDKKLTEEELDNYMMMPEAELEKMIQDKVKKHETDYKGTKKSLTEEMLQREQQKIDEVEYSEKQKQEEVKGDWTKNKSLEEVFDKLIAEKEEQEKAGKVYVDKDTDAMFDKIMRGTEELDLKENSTKGNAGEKDAKSDKK